MSGGSRSQTLRKSLRDLSSTVQTAVLSYHISHLAGYMYQWTLPSSELCLHIVFHTDTCWCWAQGQSIFAICHQQIDAT